MEKWIVGLIGGVLLAVLLFTGAGDDAAQLAAERTRQTQIEQAERTQRTAIEQDGRTERAAISAQQIMWLATERESTLRLVVVLLIVVITATAAVVIAVQLLRRVQPASAPPHRVQRLAARLPGHSIDYDPIYGWVVVAPGGEEFYTITDAERLLAQRVR